MLAKKHKGYTLIEVIISLFIIAVITTAIMSIEILALNLKNKQDKIDKAILVMETASKIIKNNLTYEEVFHYFGNNDRYIQSTHINGNSYKNSNIINISSVEPGVEYPFVGINVVKDDSNEVVKVTFNYKVNEGDNLTYVFYKGKY
jgi:prepilin-type N-terminal cleavage/methylation domain-containing protein